jgi:L-amino acid N-acyltransferase YncA
MILRDCDRDQAPAILAILNDAILNSTALYEYRPRTLEQMGAWFAAKAERDFPVIGAFEDSGELLGFSSYGTFRNWPAYKYSVEHSVYVEQGQRRRGVGRALLQATIARATAQNYHVLVGGIDAQNVVSIRLHESLGFRHRGTIEQAGFKFGRWLDLAFYQLTLDSPRDPVDG